MLRSPLASRLQRRLIAGGLVLACSIGVFLPHTAQAHFILQAPASWMSQDSLGLPEKLGPCGDEGGGTPTGTITAFAPGQTITVTINEVIFHPGHYRIALAPNDPSELPAEPPVDAGALACGTSPVESPAVYPVLADGVFEHTAPFTSPQSVQVTLPTNVTCSNCTLQIIEFMSDHGLNNPGGCFYHHCANISIGASDGGGSSDGGVVFDDASAGADTSTGVDTGAPTDAMVTADATMGGQDASHHGDASPTLGGPGKEGGGGGCAVPGSGTSAFAGAGGLFALAMLLRRRSRRAR
jgi:hypothetical protein